MKHPFNGKLLSECPLTKPLTAIVCLPLNGLYPPLDAGPMTQPQDMVRPLQQVTLRPDQFSAEGYVRLGNTPGDEANCWIAPRHVEIQEVLGVASWGDNKLEVNEDALDTADLRAAA